MQRKLREALRFSRQRTSGRERRLRYADSGAAAAAGSRDTTSRPARGGVDIPASSSLVPRAPRSRYRSLRTPLSRGRRRLDHSPMQPTPPRASAAAAAASAAAAGDALKTPSPSTSRHRRSTPGSARARAAVEALRVAAPAPQASLFAILPPEMVICCFEYVATAPELCTARQINIFFRDLVDSSSTLWSRVELHTPSRERVGQVALNAFRRACLLASAPTFESPVALFSLSRTAFQDFTEQLQEHRSMRERAALPAISSNMNVFPSAIRVLAQIAGTRELNSSFDLGAAGDAGSPATESTSSDDDAGADAGAEGMSTTSTSTSSSGTDSADAAPPNPSSGGREALAVSPVEPNTQLRSELFASYWSALKSMRGAIEHNVYDVRNWNTDEARCLMALAETIADVQRVATDRSQGSAEKPIRIDAAAGGGQPHSSEGPHSGEAVTPAGDLLPRSATPTTLQARTVAAVTADDDKPPIVPTSTTFGTGGHSPPPSEITISPSTSSGSSAGGRTSVPAAGAGAAVPSRGRGSGPRAGSSNPLTHSDLFRRLYTALLDNRRVADGLGTLYYYYEHHRSVKLGAAKLQADQAQHAQTPAQWDQMLASMHVTQTLDISHAATASVSNAMGIGRRDRFSRSSATPLDLSSFGRTPVSWMTMYEELVVGLTTQGLCGVFDEPTGRVLAFLNLSSSEKIHCLFVNKTAERPCLMYCYSCNGTRLHCRSVSFEAIRLGSAAVFQDSREVFGDEHLVYPGFVEYNAVNAYAMTLSDGRYKLWSLAEMTNEFFMDEAAIIDVKFSQSFLFVILRVEGRPDLLGLTLVSLRTNEPVKSFKIAIAPNVAYQLCELFHGYVLVKQDRRYLRVISIATGTETVIRNAGGGAPCAQVFFYLRGLFMSVYADKITLNDASGVELAALGGQEHIGRAMKGCEQTGSNLHLALDETKAIVLGTAHSRDGSDEGDGDGDVDPTDTAAARAQRRRHRRQRRGQHRYASVSVLDAVENTISSQLCVTTPGLTTGDKLALVDVVAIRFDERRGILFTGDSKGRIAVWRSGSAPATNTGTRWAAPPAKRSRRLAMTGAGAAASAAAVAGRR